METFFSQDISASQERFLNRLEEHSPERFLIERINASWFNSEEAANWYYFYQKLHRRANQIMAQTPGSDREFQWLCNHYYPPVSRFYWVMEEFYLDKGHQALHKAQRLKDGCPDLDAANKFGQLVAKAAREWPTSDAPRAEFELDQQALRQSLFDTKREEGVMLAEYRKRLAVINGICLQELKTLPPELNIVYEGPLGVLASAYQSVIFSAEFGPFILKS